MLKIMIIINNNMNINIDSIHASILSCIQTTKYSFAFFFI